MTSPPSRPRTPTTIKPDPGSKLGRQRTKSPDTQGRFTARGERRKPPRRQSKTPSREARPQGPQPPWVAVHPRRNPWSQRLADAADRSERGRRQVLASLGRLVRSARRSGPFAR
jgi:hypothetical protein